MHPDGLPLASSRLPVALATPTTLLHRAQGTLILLREVTQESSADFWYERGKAANVREKWGEAAFILEKSLLYESSCWRALLQLSVSMAGSGQPDKAALLLYEAYNLPYTSWPGFASELSSRQWEIMRQKIYAHQALQCDNFHIAFALAVVACAAAEYKTARRFLDGLLDTYTNLVNQSDAWFRLSSNVWFELKQTIRATADADRAIALAKTNSLNFSNRGEMRRKNRDYPGALTDLNQAISLDSGDSRAYLNRGVLKSKTQQYHYALQDACQDLTVAIHLDAKAPELYNSRGCIWYAQKLYVNALRDFTQAIQLNANYAVAYLNRAAVRQKQGDGAGAIADTQQAASIKASLTANHWDKRTI